MDGLKAFKTQVYSSTPCEKNRDDFIDRVSSHANGNFEEVIETRIVEEIEGGFTAYVIYRESI